MSITSSGYDGTVSEAAWAQASSMWGAPQCVFEDDDWQCSIGGAGARAVTVSAGTAMAYGVRAINSAPAVVNAASLGSGVRWDTVVLNRLWSTNTSSLLIRQGTSAQAISSAVVHTPGTEDDQVLALIRIDGGSADVGQIIDLRVMAGKVLMLPSDPSVLAYYPNGPAGLIGYTPDGNRWRLESNSGAYTWVDKSKPTWNAIGLPASVVASGAAPAWARIGGIIYLRGGYAKADGSHFAVGGGTGGAYSLGTLPVGARPGAGVALPAAYGLAVAAVAAVRLNLNTAGVLTGTIIGADVIAIRLDGVTFPAEN